MEKETLIGAAVVLVGVAVLAFAYDGGVGGAEVKGYDLQARFGRADGINVGSEVRLAGVDVGQVVAQRLDDRFRAVLTLRIARSVKLPEDSAALIETDGLLGAKFVALQPGAEEKELQPGDEIANTQGSMNVAALLEMIISQAKANRGIDQRPAQ